MTSDHGAFESPGVYGSGAASRLSPTERAIGRIWRRMFELREISPDDHFFAIGGDSVTAVDMIGEVEGLFDLALPMFLVFEAPTLASLSERIDQFRLQTDREASREVIFPLVSSGTGAPLFFNGVDLILPRQGLWTVPCPVFAIANWAAGARFTNAESLASLASFYVDSIRRIHARGPYRLGGFSASAMIAFEMAQQLLAAGESVELLFLLDPMASEAAHASFRRDVPSTSLSALDRLFPSDRSDAFWLATLRLLKGYSPRRYEGRAAVVWSNERERSAEMTRLFAPGAACYSLDAAHGLLFEPPALQAWMSRLAENLADSRG